MIKLALERSADTIKKELSYGRLRSFSYAPVYFISNSPYKQTGRGVMKMTLPPMATGAGRLGRHG
jgi:hypothetical protein